jgi:hypothetical protein
MTEAVRPDEFSEYAPRWLRQAHANQGEAGQLPPAPQLVSLRDEPVWHGPSPFVDDELQQPSLGSELESNVMHGSPLDIAEPGLRPIKGLVETVGEVSFALIAIVALALVLDNRLTAAPNAMPEAALPVAEDVVVAEAPAAPLTDAPVTNVAYVVTAPETPASPVAQLEPQAEPQAVPPQTVEQLQIQPPVQQPIQPEPVRPAQEQRVGRVLSADEVDQLVKRAEAFLNQGDVAAARLFLERAAESRDPHAILMLGTTYDPDVLHRMGVVGIRPDREQAQVWYARAAEFGSREARQRLTALTLTTR